MARMFETTVLAQSAVSLHIIFPKVNFELTPLYFVNIEIIIYNSYFLFLRNCYKTVQLEKPNNFFINAIHLFLCE